MNEPIIGLPTYNAYGGAPEYVMPRAYCQAIRAAGGIPLLLPLLREESALRRLYALLDGLLLCGGGDVATDFYGAADSGKLTLVDRERDWAEGVLVRWALADARPILGICRGIQSLNVAAGGTLIQDIPSALPDALPHQISRQLPAGQPAHAVALRPDSRLAQWLGLGQGANGQVAVNSYHHQAVKDVAPGFAVTARAPDGVIEGIEYDVPGAGWAIGVQWHPERMVPEDATMRSLFRHFVTTCQR